MMPPFIVKRRLDIPIGHRLMKHTGKCSNCHGHNIKIIVSVGSLCLNKNDMVIDFHDLDSIIKNIVEKWDHGMLLNQADQSAKNFTNVITFPYDPTAEVLSRFIFSQLQETLPEKVFPIEVEIFENEKSSAVYKKSKDIYGDLEYFENDPNSEKSLDEMKKLKEIISEVVQNKIHTAHDITHISLSIGDLNLTLEGTKELTIHLLKEFAKKPNMTAEPIYPEMYPQITYTDRTTGGRTHPMNPQIVSNSYDNQSCCSSKNKKSKSKEE